MRGKTISVFIPDSNPRGIKICDIENSIAKAIFMPRSKISEAASREDVSSPGIYFLFGKEDEISKPKVYIGEAENLIDRIKQHNTDTKKDFWNTAIGFVSVKGNLNKAHIKYLEGYGYLQALKIGRCRLENGNKPTMPSLTERDIDFVLSFYDDLKILIATLGYPIFEETQKEQSHLFYCTGLNVKAEAEYTEDGMMVFKGSTAKPTEVDSANDSVANLRNSLIEKGVLVEDDHGYVFAEDYTFPSPSAATNTILGRNTNGWLKWKDKNGITLDERFRQPQT